MRLEREHVDLLRELAEAARAVPRDERTFRFLPILNGPRIEGPLVRTLSEAEAHDLDDLVSAGLLRIRSRGSHGLMSFTVAPEAHDFLAAQAEQSPLAQIEDRVVRRYLDEPAFRARYPEAYARWSEAAALLWSEDPDAELTTVGHKAREAVQAFAVELVASGGITDPDPNPAKTVKRLRTVIHAHQARFGEAHRDLLSALVSYWGEVNDLIQRQEHGGQKEGEPLTWEDGRLVVFQTAMVMYEIDRVVKPAS
jgi:hypothetical protein